MVNTNKTINKTEVLVYNEHLEKFASSGYMTLQEMVEDGWKIAGLMMTGKIPCAIMTKNGYVELCQQVEKKEMN